MTKRILFSLFTGMLFGILLAASPDVQAQTDKPCDGYCEHQILRNGCVSYFAGCSLHFDANGYLDGYTCFYVNTCVTRPNPY